MGSPAPFSTRCSASAGPIRANPSCSITSARRCAGPFPACWGPTTTIWSRPPSATTASGTRPSGFSRTRSIPACRSFCSDCSDDGYPLYVVTSKPTVYSDRIIERFGLDRFFIEVYGPELDGRFDEKRELVEFILRERVPRSEPHHHDRRPGARRRIRPDQRHPHDRRDLRLRQRRRDRRRRSGRNLSQPRRHLSGRAAAIGACHQAA